MENQAVAAARELVPLITSARQETEAGRRIAPRVVDALRAARLGRIALPEELGGLGLAPPDALPIYELLAGAEASASWIVWNSTLPCFFGRFLTPEARAEIFGNPDWLYGGS